MYINRASNSLVSHVIISMLSQYVLDSGHDVIYYLFKIRAKNINSQNYCICLFNVKKNSR